MPPVLPRPHTSHQRQVMRFCRVCKAVLHDPEGKDVCSRACQERLRQYKKRDYDKKKRRERWDVNNRRFCIVCGARLRCPGRYCKKLPCQKAKKRSQRERWRDEGCRQ